MAQEKAGRVRWDAAAYSTLFSTILETHPIKLDYDKIANEWPTTPTPTTNALRYAVINLKKQGKPGKSTTENPGRMTVKIGRAGAKSSSSTKRSKTAKADSDVEAIFTPPMRSITLAAHPDTADLIPDYSMALDLSSSTPRGCDTDPTPAPVTPLKSTFKSVLSASSDQALPTPPPTRQRRRMSQATKSGGGRRRRSGGAPLSSDEAPLLTDDETDSDFDLDLDLDLNLDHATTPSTARTPTARRSAKRVCYVLDKDDDGAAVRVDESDGDGEFDVRAEWERAHKMKARKLGGWRERLARLGEKD